MSGQPSKPGGLELASATVGGVVTLTLRGELDLASAGALEQSLAAAERDRSARIVIDIADLHFIDSSGLRVLLLAAGRAREQDRELVLTRGGEAVQRVFELTGALDVLRFAS